MKKNHYFRCVLIVCLFFGISIFVIRICVRFVCNLSWLSLTRAISKDEIDEKLYDRSAHLIEVTLALDPSLPRLPAAQDWFERYVKQALVVQRNREVYSQINNAICLLNALGELPPSEEQHLQEIALQRNDIEAWLLLASGYEKDGDHATMQQVLNDLNERIPEYPIRNAFVLGIWRLEGYDWLPISTGLHQQVRVMLYWRSTVRTTVMFDVQSQVYRWNDRMVQVVNATNYISNGDFERLYLEGSSLLPQPWHVYAHDMRLEPSPGKLVPDDRASGGQVALLRNIHGETMINTFLPLNPRVNYFVVAQARATGDGVYMVMENVEGTNWYPFSSNLSGDDRWAAYAGIFSIRGSPYLPGVYLGISGSLSDTVKFDSLGVFEINLPPMNQ